MRHVAILAILADRFTCTPPVIKYLPSRLGFKWPMTRPKPAAGDAAPSLSLAAEESLRQTLLASWFLDQPTRFAAAARQLILGGSRRWSVYAEDEEVDGAMWWDLPAGIEKELQYRRECILNAIASAPQHFLSLYGSRDRQCQLGYDSSPACDSYQLGEMVRFLVHKNLLFLVNFSPKSLEAVPDFACVEIGHFLDTLRQCPAYQIDRHHTNCGMRTKVMPALDYLQAMLSSSAISFSSSSWETDRAATTWQKAPKRGFDVEDDRTFRFQRALVSDPRLRMEGAMALHTFAKNLFTADAWNWTPGD
jgi:hypothetical protein